MTVTETKLGRSFRDHKQRVTISLPPLEFCDLSAALQEDRKSKPVIKHRQISGFDHLDHLTKIQMIDAHNQPFRFYYVPASRDGKELYFRVPIIGNPKVNPVLSAQRISREVYDRNAILVDNVGRLDRIIRAIPFQQLTVSLRRFLIATFIAEEEAKLSGLKTRQRSEAIASMPKIPFYEKTVVIGLDRGNRLPPIILSHLLNPETKPLFVSANGCVDERILETMAKKGAFAGKHLLLVDAETIGEEKLESLSGILGPNSDPQWLRTLGHTGWSIASPSDNGHKIASNHLAIDWGINSQIAFGSPLPEVKNLDSRHQIAATVKKVFDGYVCEEAVA